MSTISKLKEVNQIVVRRVTAPHSVSGNKIPLHPRLRIPSQADLPNIGNFGSMKSAIEYVD
jgi:hypothetical protein